MKLLKTIVQKNNVILSLKKDQNYKINYLYIYLNALFLMVLFIGVFFIGGLIFGLQYRINYMFYALSFSVISTYVIIKVMIEMKIMAQLKIEYNPLLPIINEIVHVVGVVAGTLAIYFMIIMPEVSQVIDKILVLGVCFSTLLYFNLWRFTPSNTNSKYMWSILYNTLMHTLLFVLIQVLIPISEPWILSNIYMIVIFCLYVGRDIIKRTFGTSTSMPAMYSWLLLFLAVYIFFAFGSNSMLFSSYSDTNIYTKDIALQKEDLLFINEGSTIEFEYFKDHYYFIEYLDNDNYKLTITTKEMNIVKTDYYSERIEFKRTEDHLYLYRNRDQMIDIYEIIETELIKIALVSNYFNRSIPIIVDDTYYIVVTTKFFTSGVSIFNMNDLDNEIDQLSLNDPIFYMDEQVIVLKKTNADTYTISYREMSFDKYLYSNGYLAYIEGKTMNILSVDDYFLGGENHITINNDNGYLMLYAYDEKFYLESSSYLKIFNKQGIEIDSLEKEWQISAQYGQDLYAQIYKIDANGLAKKGYRLYDLDQQMLSRRVFREIRLKNQEILGIEFFWAQSITVLMIVSIIFYKKPNSVWIELIKKGSR